MSKDKKYTYYDWLNGHVVLKYDLLITNGEKPKIISWDDFKESDAVKIKKEQKRIFEVRVEKYLQKFKEHFTESYKKSLEKEKLKSEILNKCESILNKRFDVDTPLFFYDNMVFSYENIIKIQECYLRFIIHGEDVDLNFIHSEKSSYQNTNENLNNYSYAFAIYYFKDWLTKEHIANDIDDDITADEIISKSEINFHLNELRDAFTNNTDFVDAVSRVYCYLNKIEKKTKGRPVFVKNGNIKKLAFALGNIWRHKKNEIIDYNYLVFLKKNFSIFSNQIIDKRAIHDSNLYKYLISTN